MRSQREPTVATAKLQPAPSENIIAFVHKLVKVTVPNHPYTKHMY